MLLPAIPSNDTARLAALRKLQILDSETQADFSAFTNLASSICQTPVSVITLIDETRAWFLSSKGFGDVKEGARETSFCSHTILDNNLMVVDDTLTDPRFVGHPYVVGDPNIRFYAGVPLTTQDGFNIGALCVVDHAPKKLNDSQKKALHELGIVTTRLIESRLSDLRRRDAERLLKKGEQRLQFALDAAGIGDWDLDFRSNISRRSLSHDMKFGYSQPVPEWGYETFLAHVDSIDRQSVNEQFQRALSGNADFDVEFRVVWPDGSIHWLWAKGQVYVDQQGNRSHIAGIVADISERKAGEVLRASLKDQLRESQKMEAIGTLASGIAHDINNILGVVIGNAALAKEDVSTDSVVFDSLSEIQKAGLRGRDVVQQILSFSRLQPTNRRAVNIAKVIDETVHLLRTTIPARVSIALNISDLTPLVEADLTQFQQVIINLVTNAVYTIGTEPGRIDIEVRPVQVTTQSAFLPPVKPGEYALISIADTGQGIDEKTQKRIFEPFFTTKPMGEGTGLGLSVVQGIVEAHEGAIRLESRVGEGSTFMIYWPAAAGKDAVDAVVDDARLTVRLQAIGSQHILYIDDDEALVYLFTRMFERRGFKVSGFTDSTNGLDALRTAPNNYDVLVTDYNMPGANGLTVAKRAKSIRANLPVILISGYITDDITKNASEIGVSDVVFKPNAVDDLCDAIQRIMSGTSRSCTAEVAPQI